jgi:Uma2 family endonuclease
MATPNPQLMSLAEFLHWDDGTDRRYALIRGRPVAMAPPSVAHAVILSNTGAALKQRVRPPYYVAAEVGVVPPERDDTYYLADVAVSCTPTPATAQYLVDPVLIVEVLSPSTAAHDRTQKLPDYRRIASVQEIVLVSSQERRVEIWRRKGGKWEVEDLIGEAVLRLDSIRADLPVGAIYEGVDLMPEADAR